MKKYRHELKFIISYNMALVLQQQLKLIMDFDSFSLANNSYFIRSLYFDDLKSSAYYEKLNGVLYRKKYRIRLYNHDDSFIRLERKLKYNNLTSKDQVNISKEMCYNIIEGNIDNIETNNQLLKDFITDTKQNYLKPSVIVDYMRTAYTYPISEVRVTFDSEIKSGRYNYDLFDKNVVRIPVISDNEVVLEVKFNEIIPEHIATILETIPMYRQAVSKFALCRSIK